MGERRRSSETPLRPRRRARFDCSRCTQLVRRSATNSTWDGRFILATDLTVLAAALLVLFPAAAGTRVVASNFGATADRFCFGHSFRGFADDIAGTRSRAA